MTLELWRLRALQLVAAAGVVGVLAMHGLGPSHDLMEVVHTAAAPMPHAPTALSQTSTSDAHRGSIRRADAVPAALATVGVARPLSAGLPDDMGMPGACLAVLAASVVLLVLTRLRAGRRLICRVPPPPATGAGRRPRAPPAPTWHPHAHAHLCIWRT